MTVYTYTTIDDPSATNGTYAFGINDLGQIVGYYTDLSNYVHSFLYSGGIYTTIDDPSATNGTYADSINASGQITGGYRDDSGGHGFLYSGGIYTTIDDPSAINGTYADGINASGQITGFYYDGSWGPHGFLYSGGTYTTIDYPSATNVTVPESINDLGQIVGYYDDASGRHGFLYSSGTYTTIDDPSGTNGTVVTSINDLGQITGYYQDASGAHGFLYSSGTYTTIDYPSAANLTVVTSINDLGQITGYYQDASGIHGFLADPIPPVNDHAPVMTTAGIQTVAENTTAVTTVTATDPDAGQALSYSIIGGADAGKFTIGSNTGALSFITAPNFELPTDAGGNNVYDVTVQVSDGHGGTDSQAIAVTVTNTNDVPTITSNGSGAAASVSVLENSTAVTTVAATDPDAGQTLSYSIIGGADAGKFTIASNTGTLSFITAPNFDLPIDVDGNNVYDVTVQISDGVGGVDTQAIAVKVENVVGVSIIGTPGNDLIDATHTVAGQPFPTNEEDTLNGGSGADQMSGGAGNDAYVVDNISDVVTENASAGSDTVYASVDYRLTANVENLVLQGSAAQGYGNALGNAIYGTGGDNILDGDAGADSMYGGAGNDAYFLDNIGDSVIRERQRGQRHGLCDRQLPAGGECGIPGAARQRHAGLRQRPLERDLRHRRGQPARRRCRRRLDVWRGRQRRVFPRQHRRRGGRERQRGQRHGLCDRQLSAGGQRGVPGAAGRRRPGLRQRPVERDLRHRRGQPARRRCRCRLDVWRGRQRRVFPRQHRRRGGRERQRGQQRHGLCDRQLSAGGQRGEPGAAGRRRAGLRQRPVERDLRHRRGQPARRR